MSKWKAGPLAPLARRWHRLHTTLAAVAAAVVQISFPLPLSIAGITTVMLFRLCLRKFSSGNWLSDEAARPFQGRHDDEHGRVDEGI